MASASALSVSGGGCSGFQYGFALDDKVEDGDILIDQGGAAVVVDGMSLMYVLGSGSTSSRTSPAPTFE